MENDMIGIFLDKRLLTSPRTRKNYRSSINTYFKIIKKDMDTYFNDKKKPEQYEDDLRKMYMTLDERKTPLFTRRALFNAIKQFMIFNDRTLGELEFWDTLKMRFKGAESATEDMVLNPGDLKELIGHGNTLTRALFLMLESSGRRIGEILALTPKDVDITKEPTTVRITKGLVGKEIRSTKTKATTLCFISNEARDAYIAWMKERDNYLQSSVKKSRFHNKDPKDPRIFPMSYDNASFMWRKLIEREGIDSKYYGKDEKTNRGICHPHILRRVFRSYLGDSDFAEYLMGHATPLTKAYRQMKPEDMAARYLELMPNISIFESPANLTRINESLKEKDDQILQQSEEIRKLKEEIEVHNKLFKQLLGK